MQLFHPRVTPDDRDVNAFAFWTQSIKDVLDHIQRLFQYS